ncbi:hypothetical protein V6N11_080274 [Hibiscus sabdariffa]|uniref:Uncharacterized protein n=1 Tax=Hibiscus sabdariffa TaxID=183260 RepID=A0ABR2R7T3_9ROSI
MVGDLGRVRLEGNDGVRSVAAQPSPRKQIVESRVDVGVPNRESLLQSKAKLAVASTDRAIGGEIAAQEKVFYFVGEGSGAGYCGGV